MPIATGQTFEKDPRSAAADVRRQIGGADAAFILFFCSVSFDLDDLAARMRDAFPGVPVFGCTSAGELGLERHSHGSLVAASFPAGEFTCAGVLIPNLSQRNIPAIDEAAAQAKERMGRLPHRFGLLLVDGMSMAEEIVAQVCQQRIAPLPLVGGSAGDDMAFKTTYVFWEGAFRQDCAVLALITSSVPVQPFRTHNFFGAGAPLVVTRADMGRRIIQEINGRPAGEEYAAVLGVKEGLLGPERFAESPLMVRINGIDYVRSVQALLKDGSLQLYCSIDRGVVLRVGRRSDCVQNRTAVLDSVRQSLGSLELVLAFDCVLTHMDGPQDSQDSQAACMDELYREHRIFGLNTYGEQYYGLHMNQTLTGIAFGKAQRHG